MTDPTLPALPKGAEAIDAFVKTLPQMPGVYRMMNARGDVLYVGKAKNLKKRVTAYTLPDKHPLRIRRMIFETVTMEFVTTHTEAEALLLEANMIKTLKPRYNILLRDDKAFPYIRITDHDYPQVAKHRGARDDNSEYFGPFASGFAVNETLTVLQRAFLLRNCTDHIFAVRTRPCLQYQIKRCTAPCVNRVTKEQYAAQVDQARQFLKGKSRAIQDEFAAAMEDASNDMDYETAAFYRDRIRALTQIQAHQNIHVEGMNDADVHALYRDEDGIASIQVFFFRGGQNFGNRAYFPRHERDETDEDILTAFISQFYATRPSPREIIVSHPLTRDRLVIEEALSLKSGHKVGLSVPARGAKKDVVTMAVKNAGEALARKRATAATQDILFEKMAALFGLASVPERVEVYDNSHTSGTQPIGAMVVASPEGFQKNSYRKFNIKGDIRPGDDYAMMREVLTRRFQGMLRDEAADGAAPRPDLLLIDGGEGQLNAVAAVMADLGVSDIPLVAIAKGPDRNAGRERFFMTGREAFSLPPDDPVLHLLQRLRDEVHRFAITTHRARRAKAFTQNPLDQVPGIGGKRKKALLMHFGSAKAVAAAGIADLQKVDGISRAAAERIYGFFHETES